MTEREPTGGALVRAVAYMRARIAALNDSGTNMALDPAGVQRFAQREVEKVYYEDERAARYRAMYDDLGSRVVAYPDGSSAR